MIINWDLSPQVLASGKCSVTFKLNWTRDNVCFLLHNSSLESEHWHFEAKNQFLKDPLLLMASEREHLEKTYRTNKFWWNPCLHRQRLDGHAFFFTEEAVSAAEGNPAGKWVTTQEKRKKRERIHESSQVKNLVVVFYQEMKKNKGTGLELSTLFQLIVDQTQHVFFSSSIDECASCLAWSKKNLCVSAMSN